MKWVFAAAPAHAAPPSNCASAFGFEMDPTLSIRNLTVMLEPTEYSQKNAYLAVRVFDTDFLPERQGKSGIAIVYGGGKDLSDEVVGGMVLSRFEAYFDEDKSKALNSAKGGLNAVFVLPSSAGRCAGATYTISLERNGVFSVDGRARAKVELSDTP